MMSSAPKMLFCTKGTIPNLLVPELAVNGTEAASTDKRFFTHFPLALLSSYIKTDVTVD